MRRMLTPLLMILTALALALPVGSTRAAERGVAFAALLPDTENWYDYGPTQGRVVRPIGGFGRGYQRRRV